MYTQQKDQLKQKDILAEINHICIIYATVRLDKENLFLIHSELTSTIKMCSPLKALAR